MGDGLTLSKQDERRAIVLGQVAMSALSIQEAGALLGLGERQVRRLVSAYRREGPRGIVHGNRGRAPVHALTADVRSKIVAFATGEYAGINHSHLAELLGSRSHGRRSAASSARLACRLHAHSAGGPGIAPGENAIPRKECCSR